MPRSTLARWPTGTYEPGRDPGASSVAERAQTTGTRPAFPSQFHTLAARATRTVAALPVPQVPPAPPRVQAQPQVVQLAQPAVLVARPLQLPLRQCMTSHAQQQVQEHPPRKPFTRDKHTALARDRQAEQRPRATYEAWLQLEGSLMDQFGLGFASAPGYQSPSSGSSSDCDMQPGALAL